jgi:hypothetical protein
VGCPNAIITQGGEEMGENITKIHVESRTIKDFVIDPDHHERTESEEFRATKKRLKEDGHYHCYICGSTENLQVHHRALEYMFTNVADFDKVKEFCEEWDIYGYGKLLKNKPFVSQDDIRNQMVLCQKHHTGEDHENGNTGTGIHSLTFSSWIIQKLCKDGANPVPQSGETGEVAMERVREHESKDA